MYVVERTMCKAERRDLEAWPRSRRVLKFNLSIQQPAVSTSDTARKHLRASIPGSDQCNQVPIDSKVGQLNAVISLSKADQDHRLSFWPSGDKVRNR